MTKWVTLTVAAVSFAGLAWLVTLFATASGVSDGDVQMEKGIVFGKGGERDLKLDLTRPKSSQGKMPALVFIHGGGWTGGNRESFHPFMLQFSKQGMVCITVQYRFAPQHRFPAQLEDVKCAVRWLRANAEKYHVDPERIAAFGVSAGAHLAALLGTTAEQPQWEGLGGHAGQSSRVCVVVGLAGPYDLLQGYQNSVNQLDQEGAAVRHLLEGFLGGNPQQMPAAYREASPLDHVSKESSPALLMHGAKDTLVLIEQSEAFEKKLKESGVEVALLRIEDGTHNDFGSDPGSAISWITGRLQEHLFEK